MAIEPFIGEISVFAGNFPPRGWAFCDGQILAIASNTALFSLLGTTYGGDGRTTFGLPDLRGRVPVHAGQGPGLSPYPLGALLGVEYVTLTQNQMPAHTHLANGNPGVATSATPADSVWAASPSGVPTYAAPTQVAAMAGAAVDPAGGNLPHDNMQPYLGLNFIIALQGVYPPRP